MSLSFIDITSHLKTLQIQYLEEYQKDFNFSDNIFISKDFHIIDELANYLESTKRYKNCLEFLDLRYCNFSIEEIELLKHKLRSCNLLI